MSIIKGKGAPGSKTKGFIGDIYINELTGKEYECVNACTVKTHSGAASTYAWEAVDGVDAESVAEVKVEEEVEVKEEPVEEVKVEEAVEEVKEKKSKRTNYNAAYNKKEDK